MEIYNFSAGPSMLPIEVREQIVAEWTNWRNTNVSIVEISHRSDEFMQMLQETENDLRELLAIPNNYRVLFLQGGSQTQFSLVPMNLLGKNPQADYLVYGHWASRAHEEAKRYGQIRSINVRRETSPSSISSPNEWQINPEAAYLHFCTNETIDGMALHAIPHVPVPLVADMSSDILARPIDVSKFGVIYACTQKNMGVPGLAVVIVRDDLLDQSMELTPTVLNYKKQNEVKSLYNTANTFACYVAGLVFAWNKRQGGLVKMQEINERKASKLYAVIDETDAYLNNVAPANRSIMNVTFNLKQRDLEETFLQEAKKEGLFYLRGHKVSGGIRASIYNAMPEKGVDCLIEFMREFARR